MRKTKEDSRNNTIAFYHNITGLSYKECRRNLKACNWSIHKVLFSEFDLCLSNFTESCKEHCNRLVKSLDDLAEALKSATKPICENLANFSGTLNELSKEAENEDNN